MKQLLVFGALIFTCSVLCGQIIVNADGTHSIVAGLHTHNSDGTVSVIHGNHLIHQNGSVSVIPGSPIIDQNDKTSVLSRADQAPSTIIFWRKQKNQSAMATASSAFERNRRQLEKLDAKKKTKNQQKRLKKQRKVQNRKYKDAR